MEVSFAAAARFAGLGIIPIAILGLAPQALCSRLLRRLCSAPRSNARGCRFLFQLPNPLLQELPLWFLLGQRQSFLIRGPSLSGPAEPAVHIRAG